MRYLENTKIPRVLKVGDIIVEMKYSENDKTFNECMLNILKQKIKQKCKFFICYKKGESNLSGRKKI